MEKNLNLSTHSKQRIQQRGIRMDVVKFIYENGRSVNSYKRINHLKLHSKKYFVNKKILRTLKHKNCEEVKKFQSDILNTIIIVCPKTNLLITVYKSDKKIIWN